MHKFIFQIFKSFPQYFSIHDNSWHENKLYKSITYHNTHDLSFLVETIFVPINSENQKMDIRSTKSQRFFLLKKFFVITIEKSNENKFWKNYFISHF